MKVKHILAALCAMAALTTPLAAETTLRFAHPTPEADIQHKMAEFFAAELAERSGGELNVQIFPGGQLGSDAQAIDGTRSGTIDITIAGLNNYTGLVPEAAAFTLPFMFPTRETAYRVLDGDVGQGVGKNLEEFGLVLLGYPENGFRNMTNNTGPIRVPADVEGLQMRVNNSQALSDMFQALGANPIQLDVNELYTSLETGVVNAQDHPVPVTLSFRFYEVQDYLSLTRHAYSPLGWVMNKAKFDKLSPEMQSTLMEVAAESVAHQRGLAVEGEDAMLAQLSEHLQINDDVDGAAFQAAVRPAWDGFVSEHGDTLINAILEASSK
ncbi:DctP family TRAP transporter solute-binding subunit [Hoeflea prorocentri]|uniref:DctP family TRAP transporter solute-binding subunit n=1 Tax=Hoeflea prorocentri TaxID=1922333 RepID=A0A9X3UN73_9HYPH|nr:DctP family TRAP transporter solute-binding subunit [Hoeflea prorocentri]MCY6383739.1 DctP family TRAP transporter solute-binding subunit [Hoeflea prorocentri]MDA5401539.1 DctP family TRAP transporter solute-binding subunit [Hoeflea prorocentri]